jgi:hypothetical protein
LHLESRPGDVPLIAAAAAKVRQRHAHTAP